MQGLSDVIQIAAGAGFSAAVTAGGEVWTWGDGGTGHRSLGQVGDGGFSSRAAPARVHGLSGVTRVACGGAHVLVLTEMGRVLGWGYSGNAELARRPSPPTTTVVVGEAPRRPWVCEPSPLLVELRGGVLEVAAGGAHSLALDVAGHTFAWGSAAAGQVGRASPLAYAPGTGAPVAVVPVMLPDPVELQEGSEHDP